EIQACADNGIEFVELFIGRDALSVITSPDNKAVECLSFLDLYALLGPEAEGSTWSDADDLAGDIEGALEGKFGASHAPYPDEDLVVTAPGEESGTYDSFVELAFDKIAEERGVDGAARPDYQASPNDNVIIEGVGGSSSSLGWVGFAFVKDNLDTVKAIEVDGGDGCVAPSDETVNDGTYPLSRGLLIYVNKAKAEENAALSAFVDFYLSDEGLASVTEVGYVAMTDEEITATRATWDAKTTGTHET
ncbi:MAG TPA: substrate-binding domain-containing protein, partial [Acidimicrobiia bacterium]|nr:substrate-binding domain-containing protein [Acidimicrobiia bacterium]